MRGWMLAVAAGLCWGVGELCTKSVLHSGKVGPLSAIALRSTIALPVIWLAWWLVVNVWGAEARPALRELSSGDVLRLVLGSGLCAGALGMVFFYGALALDDVSRIKPIAFTIAPATAALLGWHFLGEGLGVRKLVALALILGGVALLASAPRPERHDAPTELGR